MTTSYAPVTQVELFSQDELKEFNTKLKELLIEFQALMDLKESVKAIDRQRQDTLKKQTEINKDITKVRAADGDMVKSGMFGKMSKSDKIKELEEHMLQVGLAEQATSNLNALISLKSLVVNLLNSKEFPRVVVAPK